MGKDKEEGKRRGGERGKGRTPEGLVYTPYSKSWKIPGSWQI